MFTSVVEICLNLSGIDAQYAKNLFHPFIHLSFTFILLFLFFATAAQAKIRAVDLPVKLAFI